MALANGDYKNIEEKVVAAILADNGGGGLLEAGDPAVATVMAADPSAARALGADQFPAILIRAVAKKESPTAPVYSVLKNYSVQAVVLDRSMDRDAVEETVRKIAARLEWVLREQSATDKQFLGLPDLIDGGEGVLVSNLRETKFSQTDAGEDRVMAKALVIAEIQAPCAFRYE